MLPKAYPYVPVQEPQAQPLDYAQITGQLPAAAPPSPAYAQMQQPAEQEFEAQVHQPTTDFAEIESRKQGWMQVLQKASSDPNLMRALGMFGSQMMQPIPQGQTGWGQFGQAAMLGRTAYDFGNEAEFQRQLLLRKEGRTEETHRAGLEQTGVETQTARARLPGVQAASDVAVQTKDSAIQKVQNEAQLVTQQLANAKTEAERKRIQLDWDKRVEAIKKGVPDAKIRKQIDDELEGAGLKNLLTRAQIGASGAAAGASGAAAASSRAKTVEQELENKDLAGMTPAERIAFRSRSKSGTSSAQVQLTEFFGNNWKKANPKKAEESSAQYEQRAASAQHDFMTKTKGKNEIELLPDFVSTFPGPANETPEEAIVRLRKALGTTPAGAATGRAAPKAAPKVGATITRSDGKWKFKGGNPADQKNWEKVE